MRALLDANVYISHLLHPESDTPPAAVVGAGLDGLFTLVITDGIILEFREKIVAKPYLANRITSRQLDEFAETLAIVAESIADIGVSLPEVGRDRKDDYLYAYALIGQVDYLVSGDKDLLAVRQIGDVRIVNPAEFFRILQSDEPR